LETAFLLLNINQIDNETIFLKFAEINKKYLIHQILKEKFWDKKFKELSKDQKNLEK